MTAYDVVDPAERAARGRSGQHDELDPISREWLAALSSPGVRRVQALGALHQLLVRAARRELGRRSGSAPHLGGQDRDDLAHEVADDALLAILERLGAYRGESRFTTWAYAFVMYRVSGKLAREARRSAQLTMDSQDWERLSDRLSTDAYASLELRATLRALRAAVQRDLTPRQRLVFTAVALNEAPIDAVAVELGSNRNAIYKTLFDARSKLRASLEASGHPLASPDEGIG